MSSFPISITWQVASPPTASFDSLAKSAQSLDQAMLGTAGNFDKFGQSVSQMESPLSGVTGSMGQLEGSMSGLEGSIGSAAGSMGEFAGSTEQLNGAIGETGGFITDASSSMSELSGTTGETGSAMTELSGTTGEFNGVVSETGGFVTETGTAMTDMGTAALDGGTAMTELNTATTDTNTALTESVDALSNVVPGLEDTATGAADSAQGFSDLAPPIEDSNTALDASSGLLEGVSPLLADTGVNAGDAATGTGDFSGALGGLGDELGPVNGGLTTANTLVGDVGDEALTTANNTGNLKDSMGTLALGLTTVVGAGYGLVNSFLAIRDAGFKVEAANIRAEKSATTLDKAVLGVGKAIQKLATDSEAPIKGMTALQTAFANFQKLVAAGIISGPQFATALNNLKIAADGLEGSTVKDNNAISALNISIDGLGQKAAKADLDARKLNKTMEQQTKAYVDAGLSVATFVGGMGTLVTTITSAGSAAGVLKGAMATLGTTISTSVLPAIAGIAVPVGIAIGALAAFVGAVTAIRMNIRVFDELGVKIGKVFPEMKDFLDDARQAFINLSDGINSAISFILGGIDSFAGGTTNLKAQWEGFTGTLPKGTGEMGTAGKAMGQLGHIATATGEQINIGKGKWEDMNGTLVAFGGKVKVAAGGWHELRDGTAVYSKDLLIATAATEDATTAQDAFGATAQTTGVILREQSANYSELTNAQQLSVAAQNKVIEGLSDEKLARFNAVTEAEKYLVAHGTTAKAVGLSGDVLIGYVNSLKNEGPAYSASVQKATEYLATKHKEIDLRGKSEDWILKTAAAMEEEDKALGKVTETTAKHVEELNKLQQAHADAAAEIAFYSDATNMANRMQLEYEAGIDNANLKLIDQQAALANTAGELQRNFELLDQGTLQEIAYSQGVQEAAKKLQDKILALEKMKGAYEATNAMMKEGTLIATEFATGMQKTKTAIQEETLELVNLVGQLQAYSQGTVTADANNNALVRGFLEQRKATVELSQGYAEAQGKLVALRMELKDSENAIIRFNTGMAEGKASALEWKAEIQNAKGEAIGFRSEVKAAGEEVGLSMKEMASMSTEQIQLIVEAFNGLPSAMDSIISSIDELGQKVVDSLTKAGEEGKINFMENINALEEEMHTTFSEPVKQELLLIAKTEEAKKSIQSDIEVLAALLRNKPLEVAIRSAAAQSQIQQLREKVAALPADVKAGLGPLQAGLDGIAAWTPGQGIPTLVGHLGEVVAGSKNLEGGMAGAITSFQNLYDQAAQSAEGLAALKASFEGMGLSFDTNTGIITDKSGKIVEDLQVMGEDVTNSMTTTTTAIDTLGPAGTAARTTLAFEIVALEFLINRFAQETKQSAIEVSTAFANMATNSGTNMMTLANTITGLAKVLNTFASSFMSAFARDVATHFATAGRASSTFATLLNGGLSTAAQQLAKFGDQFLPAFSRSVQTSMSQAGSYANSFASQFGSAMSKVQSSATNATSRVKALQSAINALKSKTITITTIIRTVRQTVFAAQGGAFIQSTPGKVGPLSVSEFGQKELVSVTPLQTPGRQTVKGLSNLIQGETEKKTRRMLDEEGERREPSKKKEMVMMRETPIIVQVDGREIARVVNRRLFEESDALV